MKNKYLHIIELSERLAGLDKLWYHKTIEPLPERDVAKWCKDNGVYMPQAFTVLLGITNGFCVDYASTVGYFTMMSLEMKFTTKEMYGRTREQLQAREYDAYKNCLSCFGWIRGNCFY